MAVRNKILVVESADAHANQEHRRSPEELVRELGYAVVVHPSPVGVGRALAEHDADVVLLGWELPGERDEKLVHLIESWQRTRALRVIVVSGARCAELTALLEVRRDVWVVGADVLGQELPRLLEQAPRSLGRDGAPVDGKFIHRLKSRLELVSNGWDGVAQGRTGYREIEFPLAAARGQAQLLEFRQLVLLLDEVIDVVRRGESFSGGRPTPAQYEAVTAALRFALQAMAAPPYGSDRDVTPLLERLRKS